MRLGLRVDEPLDDFRHGVETVPAVPDVVVAPLIDEDDEASGSRLGRREATVGGHVPFICSIVVRPSIGWVGELVQLNLGNGRATVEEITSARSGTDAWWAAISFRQA